MKNKIVLVLVSAILFVNIAHSQGRKYVNEFLNIGAGARALGMGGAVIASVDDVTAGYWNPAGLTGIKTPMDVSLMHSSYFSGIANYDYGAIARRLNENNIIALSMIRFGIDNIPNTLDIRDASGQIDYTKIKTFSAVDYGFLVSFARSLDDKLSTGINTKIIHRNVGSFASAWGMGFDFGLQYKVQDWKFALVGRDITFTFTGWNYSFTDEEKLKLLQAANEIPKSTVEVTSPRLIGGVSRKWEVNDKFTIMPELNLHLTFDGKRNTLIKTTAGSVAPLLGCEFGYNKLAFLRTGIQNLQKETNINGKSYTSMQLTLGAGIKLKAFSIDYAFTDVGNISAALYSHIFSLKLAIGEEAERY